jgi:hypothetical protein|tara:strand:- start:178 stop:396 length:219 start_codon:yes stop_codon:yes gene_type:complete
MEKLNYKIPLSKVTSNKYIAERIKSIASSYGADNFLVDSSNNWTFCKGNIKLVKTNNVGGILEIFTKGGLNG